ncbi:MAG TPA: NAD-dependent deacylase [Deltaproteobacteria bacterium]|nr:MAG: NAD-dependent deacylase [Deltaproteobacteria bacterium GWA2_55_82]OGQ62709.1 MAG: NAD-dependent deacylase [Deltaproteobacteria bacterium RIFCSPLOWO2_02_FULL_55_12]OIJ74302.1 MAG: NAD-dependent deacylase [Deltaproteobacteria bacterium GWC2_55_46]HBG46941.1 NAD-dependent deacylase [Deltaproteobacteria bacterium]HCY11001.1 NAD-dependent deacylase [Deltaproteobacteria bacterium]
MESGLIGSVRERLKAARSLVVLTGAGVSAESGVPTFRGAEGLWRNFNPQELATPEAFEADPRLVWEWYDWRRSIIAGIRPNPAHYALAELERRSPGFTLITQNVDGLHGAAGSRNVLEIHGSIWTVRCVECGNSSENRDVPIKILPRCSCGGLLRPGVVWFGESLPEEVLYRAFEAASSADCMLVIGTSGIVQPAASLAARAKGAGAFVAEINPEATPLSDIMDARLPGKAAELMPRLV